MIGSQIFDKNNENSIKNVFKSKTPKAATSIKGVDTYLRLHRGRYTDYDSQLNNQSDVKIPVDSRKKCINVK